jgi:hypothetical protein
MLSGITIKLFFEGLGEHDGNPYRPLLGKPAKFQVRHG